MVGVEMEVGGAGVAAIGVCGMRVEVGEGRR